MPLTLADLLQKSNEPLQIGPSREKTEEAIIRLLTAVDAQTSKLAKGAGEIAFDPIQRHTVEPLLKKIDTYQEKAQEKNRKLQEDVDEDNALKMFLASSGTDIFEMLPSDESELAVEIATELIPIGKVLGPLMALLPPGGVKKALMSNIDDAIKRVRRTSPADVAKVRIKKLETHKKNLEQGVPRVFREKGSVDADDILQIRREVDDLPETLYHVTTEKRGLEMDPMIYGMGSEIEGLRGAGGAGSPGISTVADLPSAVNLKRELSRIRALQQSKKITDWDVFWKRISREDKASGVFDADSVDEGIRSAREYLDIELKHIRERGERDPNIDFNRLIQKAQAGALANYRGVRGGDPLIFGDDLVKSKFEILAFPTEDIPPGALVERLSDSVGTEFRVHSDVPISLTDSRLRLRRMFGSKAHLEEPSNPFRAKFETEDKMVQSIIDEINEPFEIGKKGTQGFDPNGGPLVQVDGIHHQLSLDEWEDFTALPLELKEAAYEMLQNEVTVDSMREALEMIYLKNPELSPYVIVAKGRYKGSKKAWDKFDQLPANQQTEVIELHRMEGNEYIDDAVNTHMDYVQGNITEGEKIESLMGDLKKMEAEVPKEIEILDLDDGIASADFDEFDDLLTQSATKADLLEARMKLQDFEATVDPIYKELRENVKLIGDQESISTYADNVPLPIRNKWHELEQNISWILDPEV
jgi:hypothetical protein